MVEEWSPFYVLPKAGLTPSGLLKLDTDDHEVELLRRTPVELRHDGTDEPMGPRPPNAGQAGEEWNSRSTDLTLILTTHRIVFCCNDVNNKNDHRFLHLSNVHVVRGTGGPSFQHPRATYKIVVSTFTYAQLVIVFRTSNNNVCQRDRDTSLEQLETSLKRKLWERAQRLQEKNANQNATVRRRVGVDHILQRQRIQQQQAQQLASNAFKGDSDQLLDQAGELLQVIRKSKALLDRMGESTSNTGGSSSSGTSAREDVEAAERLAGLLSDMGMTSALTKSQVMGGGGGGSGHGGGGGGNFGFRRGGGSSNISDSDGTDGTYDPNKMTPSQRQYYELTARQLADFLIPRLKGDDTNKKGSKSKSSTSSNDEYGRGIISLTDAYCMFNRARGTNLISPEDLRYACSLLGELKVGLTQRIFPSGVIVVQLDSMRFDSSNPDGAKRLMELCQPATTALEASHHMNISPLLAMEQLEEAERLGVLCRDVTLETVRFYPNKFVDWTV